MIRSYPSLFMLVFVVGGIALADVLGVSPYPWLLIALVAFLGALWALGRGAYSVTILFLALTLGTFAGFHFGLRYLASGPNSLSHLVRGPIRARVFGRVADWPELKQRRTDLVIDVDSLGAEGRVASYVALEGSLLLRISDTTTTLQRGDRISFVTRLYPVRFGKTEQFDYRRYLNLKGVQAIAYLPTSLGIQVDRRPVIGYFSLVDGLRTAMRESLDRNLSLRAAALARGFLIGETRDIPPALYSMFRDSGTLHLLAVSGSNVALVLLFVLWLARPLWLGPTARAILLGTVIFLFAGLSYGDPSVLRASLMALLVIGARLIGRPYNLNQIIATTALVILLVEPAQLFDVGFQLSFVTAWGLIFIVPRVTVLMKPWYDRRWYRWLVFPLIITMVAQICATPVIAYYFGRVPVISPLANLLIVPAVSVGVIGVLVLLVADLIWPLLGAFVGSLVDLWLNLVVYLLELMGGEQMPVLTTGSLFDGARGVALTVFVYGLLLLATLAVTHRVARRAVLVGLVLLINLVLGAAARASLNRAALIVTCHPVPGGIAAVVGQPGAERADLILTGLSRRPYPIDEKILKPLVQRQGIEKLDRVILLTAEFDALDDLGRLAVHYDIETWYIPRGLRSSWLDAVRPFSRGIDTSGVVWLGDGPAGPSAAGYHLSSGAVRIKLGESQLTFVDRVTPALFAAQAESDRAVLVIGNRWTPVPSDWIRLHQMGYDRIVCSDIAQPASSPWPDRETDTEGLPDYLYRLARLGACRLELPF
jgi:ComEC/Rec2-related protein